MKKWFAFYAVMYIFSSVGMISAMPLKPPVVLSSAESPAHVRIASTDVFLLPIAGYMRVKDKPMLLWSEKRMAILAEAIEHPYAEVAAAMDEKNFRSDGMELKSRTDLFFNGKQGVFFKVLDVKNDKKWAKWLLLLEDRERCILLVGSFAGGDAAGSLAVEKMLKSVVVKPLVLGESASRDQKLEEGNKGEGVVNE